MMTVNPLATKTSISINTKTVHKRKNPATLAKMMTVNPLATKTSISINTGTARQRKNPVALAKMMTVNPLATHISTARMLTNLAVLMAIPIVQTIVSR
jgi:hypothetical protein